MKEFSKAQWLRLMPMASSGWSVGTALTLKSRESSSLFVVFLNAPDSGFLLTSTST